MQLFYSILTSKIKNQVNAMAEQCVEFQ